MVGRRRELFGELKSLNSEVKKSALKELFSANANRFNEFSISLGEMTLDYSKIHFNKEILSKLFEVAKICGVEEKEMLCLVVKR